MRAEWMTLASDVAFAVMIFAAGFRALSVGYRGVLGGAAMVVMTIAAAVCLGSFVSVFPLELDQVFVGSALIGVVGVAGAWRSERASTIVAVIVMSVSVLLVVLYFGFTTHFVAWVSAEEVPLDHVAVDRPASFVIARSEINGDSFGDYYAAPLTYDAAGWVTVGYVNEGTRFPELPDGEPLVVLRDESPSAVAEAALNEAAALQGEGMTNETLVYTPIGSIKSILEARFFARTFFGITFFFALFVSLIAFLNQRFDRTPT